jgi:hypothetical protein
LNNRIKDAAASVNKSVDLLKMTAETTKTEVHEYFHRYYRELKRREENLLADIDTFHETELRLMTSLKDVLEVENNNIHDACAWMDAVLNGSKEVKDDELYRMKNVFVEGLEYLRNFQVCISHTVKHKNIQSVSAGLESEFSFQYPYYPSYRSGSASTSISSRSRVRILPASN